MLHAEDRGFDTEVTEISSLHLILLAALGYGIYSTSNRNEYHKQKQNMFLWSKAQSGSEADNLTAICDPCLDHVGFATSHKPKGFWGVLRG
jgi:hypothetical protein